MFVSLDAAVAKLDNQEVSIEQVLRSLNHTCFLRFDRGFPTQVLTASPIDTVETSDNLNVNSREIAPIGLTATIMRGLHGMILLQEIKHHDIDLPAECVQQASDTARKHLGLTSIKATEQWLSRNGLTLDDWGEAVETALAVDHLRDLLFADQLETWFAQNQRKFDQIEVARLHVLDQGVGEEIMDQLVEQEISFASAVENLGVKPDEQKQGGYLGWLRRDAVPHNIEASLFATDGPEFLGPIEIESGVVIYRVLTRRPAQFDADTQNQIANHLYREWWQQQQKRIELCP